ncbi:MAG: hypothetical protein HQK73_06360 [Desulfamplus sp.]|nr:hypothetical protein [Desulfamplus sp.]
MGKNKILALSLVCISIFIADRYSWSKDIITWGHNCIPPLYICDGEKVTGVAAAIENIIFENLKDYDHHRVNSNLERILDNLKTQRMFCSSSIAKNPERESFAYYSIPAAIVPPIHIFIRKDEHSAFGGTKMISLENTLKNGKLKFGYPSSRSFGPEIDSIIKAHSTEPHVSASYSSDVSEQQISLLNNKRIDYTIGGYFAMKFAAKKQGIEDKVLGIRIIEKQDYLILYVVCPKNDWGKKMIDKINTILRKEIPKQRYFDCFKPFYDETTQDEFQQQYENLLVKPVSKYRTFYETITFR